MASSRHAEDDLRMQDEDGAERSACVLLLQCPNPARRMACRKHACPELLPRAILQVWHMQAQMRVGRAAPTANRGSLSRLTWVKAGKPHLA